MRVRVIERLIMYQSAVIDVPDEHTFSEDSIGDYVDNTYNSDTAGDFEFTPSDYLETTGLYWTPADTDIIAKPFTIWED